MLSSRPTKVHTATIRLYSPCDAVVAKPVQHSGGNTSYIARVIYHSASLPAVRTTLIEQKADDSTAVLVGGSGRND